MCIRDSISDNGRRLAPRDRDPTMCQHGTETQRLVYKTRSRSHGSGSQSEYNPCDTNIKAATAALTTLEAKLADLEAGYSRLLALDPARAE